MKKTTSEIVALFMEGAIRQRRAYLDRQEKHAPLDLELPMEERRQYWQEQIGSALYLDLTVNQARWLKRASGDLKASELEGLIDDGAQKEIGMWVYRQHCTRKTNRMVYRIRYFFDDTYFAASIFPKLMAKQLASEEGTPDGDKGKLPDLRA